MSGVTTPGLFDAYGVEIEYMLVARDSLDVLPASDRLLTAEAGELTGEVEVGPISWSNELVLHVVELKTSAPAASLVGLADTFQEHVSRVNARAAALGGRLMPTAMHPWMNPDREMRLWPHDYGEVYEAYNRIFDCRGHGWANLQSVHLNLPFAGDDEFGRLHAAVRLVLPILPGLAASSPIVEGRPTGIMDARLDVYRGNAARVPSVAGRVIPEPAFSRAAYDREILAPMYRDIALLDREGTLQHEWLNSRGAIARFDRNTIEIRVLDAQEAPRMDLAIVAAAAGLVRMLVEEEVSPAARQRAWPVEPLAELFEAATAHADEAVIEDDDYLKTLGISGPGGLTVGEAWQRIVARLRKRADWSPEWDAPLDVILERGPLARRILAATGPAPNHDRLRAVYGRLCDCLAGGEAFLSID